MVMISPQITTTNSAPFYSRTSRTGRVWPVGAPLAFGSVEKLYWVLALQTGHSPPPSASISLNCARVLASSAMSSAR